MCSKLIKFTGIFYKIRNVLPSQLLKTIYYAFIHSLLIYGIEIYGNTYESYLNKLIIMNNKLLRIIQIKPLSTHIGDLYNNFNTLQLPILFKYQLLLFAHKCNHHKEQLPSIFSSFFIDNKSVHNYNTRNKDDIHIFSTHSPIGSRSLKFKLSFMWNNLPEYLKQLSSTKPFKTKLKIYLRDV